MSDLPLSYALPTALLAAGWGGRLGWCEWRRAPCALEFDATGRVSLHGCDLASPRLRLRGPMSSLEWRDDRGRRAALSWLADTLPVASRRQLLLRLGGQSPA